MFDHLDHGRWWDIGLDLVTGCTPVSPGCDHCWSAERTHRAAGQQNPKIRARYAGLTDAQGRFTGEVRPQWDFLERIGQGKKPQVYSIWNDLFHEGVEEEFITAAFLKMLLRSQHFYVICTKRPELALSYFQERREAIERKWLTFDRLLLMTTVENQAMADLRLPLLLQIPGVRHGVSYEPALGPVDWNKDYGWGHPSIPGMHCYAGLSGVSKLDWLIAGGESGKQARPARPGWFRQARDQAAAADVPFFFKSWGKHQPEDQKRPRLDSHNMHRLLDGQIWQEVPHGL